MVAGMTVGDVRPGYELWHPNREKPASLTVRLLIVILLLAAAALMVIVVVGGWSILNGGPTWGVLSLLLAALYCLLAYMVWNWSRGALALSTAVSVILLVLFSVGVGSWFARNKPDFSEAALPSELLGMFVVVLIPLQAAITVATAIGFRQNWYVEEERPISGQAGSGPPGEPLPAD
jgi:peptidoglycan/LPS O-acetylase OafA/YrhL